MKKKILSLMLITVMVIMSLTCAGCKKTYKGIDTNMVCIAVQPSAAFIPMFIARYNHYIEDALAEYDVSVIWYDYESGPPMNQAIATGECDLCIYGDVPTVSAITMGQEREVIGITAQAADSYAVVVLKDSPIQSAADLRGKNVATNLGSTAHNLISKYLGTAGLTLNDINLVSATPADMPYLLRKGEVDAIALWEPSITKLVDAGDCRILGEGSDCGLDGTNTIIGRKEYCQANPKVIEIVLQQYKRAADEIANTSDATWNYVAKYLGLEVSQVKSMLPKYNFSVAITQRDIDSLNDTINFLVGIGKIEKAYNIADYCNATYFDGTY
ncbi:MAG: ABC transporter substrate-binding protein [Lachnospiraceae bacterium]|nr:ABC transporter substrate-binding protein [Lachnospiraceae bacterium]